MCKMDGSPLFPVVKDKIDSHGGIDYSSGIVSSQSGDLICRGEEQLPRRLVEIAPPGKQCKDSQLILEMIETEQQIVRQEKRLFIIAVIF